MAWSNTKRSVLVPFDFTDACLRAVHVARSFVEDDGSIVVLHVVKPPPPNSPGVLWGTTTPESVQEASYASLVAVLEDAHIAAKPVTRIGDPGETIIEYADREGMEFVILPSHGRTGFSRILMGSVAERVVRYATVPVLVLREQAPVKS